MASPPWPRLPPTRPLTPLPLSRLGSEQLLTTQRMSCAHIYSALDQTARKINLAKFTHGKCSTLIVTDLAARGLDIPLLDNVINYSFPAKGKLFLHRVGKEPAGVLQVGKPRPRDLTYKLGSGEAEHQDSARQPHCSQEVTLCFLESPVLGFSLFPVVVFDEVVPQPPPP